MREPNFSESQLQQAVNTAYIRFAFEKYGVWAFANVPSLFDEFDLGWDSGFFFPWHPHPPLPEHEGCNFFIQYKLSFEMTSAGAKEWECWNAEYFRFKIPHCTKDASGKFVDDYHQWDRLKDLANKGYPTFYATNATLNKDVLREAFQAGTLLQDTPLLDVRGIVLLHKYVTFTSSSSFFLLHSEAEKSPKVSFASAISELSDNKTISLKDAAGSLLHTLTVMGDKNEGWNGDIQKITRVYNSLESHPFRAWVTHALLSSFVRKYFGTEMLWLPKKAN